MRLHSVVKGLAVACALVACSYATLRADYHNFAVQFSAANGSVATGPAIDQNDNLRMEALVRYDGPSENGGLLLYNGNGCCNGWGVLIYGTNAGANAGRLGILAGGVTFADTQQPMTLPVGEWQRIRVESRGQIVTVSFPDATPGPQFSYGVVSRNELNFGGASTFTVGDGFNGLIDEVTMTKLDTPNTLLEYWGFHEGTGSSATGAHGTVLSLTNTSWVRVGQDLTIKPAVTKSIHH
jgi:hypothetical protein